MSASLAKSVSESAKRADRRDSRRRTSSKRFFNSIGGYNENRIEYETLNTIVDLVRANIRINFHVYFQFNFRYCNIRGYYIPALLQQKQPTVVSGFV